MNDLTIYTVKRRETNYIWIFRYTASGDFHSFEAQNHRLQSKHNEWLMLKGRFPYNEIRMKHWIQAFKKYFDFDVRNIEITFELFWNTYGKKVGKKDCLAYWKKMKDADKTAAFMGVRRYKNWLKTKKDREPLDPIRYLKREVWNDELN